MATKASISTFISKKKLAIAGVSRNPQKFGYHVYFELKNKGYTLFPINPNTDTFDGGKCYHGIADLPSEVESLFITTNPSQTDALIEEAIRKGIPDIWVQQKSQTKETAKYQGNNGMNLILNHCILMFAEPVSGFHKFHRFVKGLFGGLPK